MEAKQLKTIYLVGKIHGYAIVVITGDYVQARFGRIRKSNFRHIDIFARRRKLLLLNDLLVV